MNLIKSWTIPIEVVSEANLREHWSKSYKRHKNQKKYIKFFMSEIAIYKDKPLIIKLVRLSPRKLDKHDNLPMAFKYVVDAIADLLNPGKASGRADDSVLLEWKYDHEIGNGQIRVELYEKSNPS